jgi:hypothetical protein
VLWLKAGLLLLADRRSRVARLSDAAFLLRVLILLLLQVLLFF